MTTDFDYNDTIDPGDVIAVGDIHGMGEQFLQFLEWVEGSGARVILLGDLIDRGPDDLCVLAWCERLLQDPEYYGLEGFTVIRGNHEQMFLNAFHDYGWRDWVNNGGDWENFDKLKEHDYWLKQLPYYVTIGDTLFTHAGVYPGVDPQESMKTEYLREDFLWNRGAFLRVGPEFEKDRKSTRLNSSHVSESRMPSSA